MCPAGLRESNNSPQLSALNMQVGAQATWLFHPAPQPLIGWGWERELNNSFYPPISSTRLSPPPPTHACPSCYNGAPLYLWPSLGDSPSCELAAFSPLLGPVQSTYLDLTGILQTVLSWMASSAHKEKQH